MTSELIIRDRVVELRRVRAASLLANPKNWRQHPKAQAAAMRGVLAEIGYADALLARETPDGLMLIDGHLRAETTPDATVPVLILDVTEAEADKILLTLDPLAAMAVANKDALSALFASVQTNNDDVAALLEAIAKANRVPMPYAGLTDPDEVPPVPDEPTTRPGDLWLMGEHRLLCGDATDEADVASVCANTPARLLVTDPPYGVNYTGAGGGNPKWGNKNRGPSEIENDNLGIGQQDFWEAAFQGLPVNGDIYVFAPPGPLNMVLAAALGACGIEQRQWLVWVKQHFVMGRAHYHYRHEHIFYGWQGKSSWNGSRSEDSVWEADRPTASDDHPTTKPVGLVERAILNSSAPDDVVLDPFLGSGTTLIACERLGRRCYAMELEPRYVDVAVARWENYTGQKAVLDGSC